MPAIPYPQFTAQILDLYRPPLRRRTTFSKMRKVLTEFGALGIASTDEITPALIARWVGSPAALQRRAISNRSYLAAFRAAVNVAKKLRYLEVSPWEIRRDWIDWGEDDDTVKPRHLSIEEVGKLLDQADLEADRGGWSETRLRVLVYLYLYTGLRKSEALGLRVEDLDLDGAKLCVRSRRRRRLKTRTSRRNIALHSELVQVLANWIPRCGSEWLIPNRRQAGPWLHGPRGGKALDQIQDLAARAGLPKATIQAFRRSLATHARRWGWGQLEVKDLLGHGAVETQDWYLEDNLADQRAAIDRIQYRPSPQAGGA